LPTRYHLAATYESGVFIDNYDRPVYAFPHCVSRIGGEHFTRYRSGAQRVLDLLLPRPTPRTEAAKGQCDPVLPDAAIRSRLNSESPRDRRSD
jgi:hypothetical protein